MTELSERIAGRLGGRERGGSWCALGKPLAFGLLDLVGLVAPALGAELLAASEQDCCGDQQRREHRAEAQSHRALHLAAC